MNDYKRNGPYKEQMEALKGQQREVSVAVAGMRFGRRKAVWIPGTMLAGVAAFAAFSTFIDSGGATATGKAAGAGGAEAVSAVGDVATGAKDLTVGVVGGIQEESNLSLDNPFTTDNNKQVSNTTPNSSVPADSAGNTSNESGSTEGLVVLAGTATVTEVPIGENGNRDYSAAGVVATPIQVAKACFSAGEFDMTSADWANAYTAGVLTVQSNFQEGGAFYQEAEPTLNPGDVVNCQ